MSGAVVSAWTRFPVGLEEGSNGATHVHSFTVPGCVASGPTKEAALDEFGSALGSWLRFLSDRGEAVPGRDRELEITVDEWIATDADIAAGESTVCFEADRAPLPDTELLRGVQLLGSLRGRILPLVRRSSDAELEKLGHPDWTARMILDELARAQWWTLTRLGASPLGESPDRAVARLDTSMALAVQHLVHLPASARDRVIEIEGEEWTPRKVLRRMLWLEWSLGAAALHALGTAGGGATE
ncbi:MAG: hypothetical protein WD766_06660 [Gemmatimonadota bacterium]